MNRAAGEEPTWGDGRRYALHHALVHDNTAYACWRDGSLTLLDITDHSAPKLIKHHNWSPPYGGGTHSSLSLPIPYETDYFRKGGDFGPHDLHENRPGSFESETLIFAMWQNTGIRAFDISDPYHPVETGALVPAGPTTMTDRRAGRPKFIQSADVFVDAAGLIYATDYNAGLEIIEYGG